ncbi:DUF3221 domain-containing protein [Bacillus massiliglaciei]|uniref:DUF3221 domain-containing protein n=1 Tax=Bacillus massiliglaciei TaxID=1816693 RepID=UPI0018FEDACE|nr:DUF3221 domain-containing protein [Bacillus massiliglaciei]
MKIFVMICCTLILSGCQYSPGRLHAEVGKGDEGFITSLDDKQILIKDTYYKVKDDTILQDETGRHLEWGDLEIGMKVKPWFAGRVSDTFPAKANARYIRVLTDSEAKAEQEMVTAAIRHVTESPSQRFMVLELQHLPDDHVYTLEMMSRSNLDSSFMVILDDQSAEVLYQR